MIAGPYAVRRFANAGSRPDCWEVYDTRDGKTASLPGRKAETVKYANVKNANLNNQENT